MARTHEKYTATNGIIHVIDAVMLPANLEEILEDCIPPMGSFEPSEHPTSPPSERDGDAFIKTPPQIVPLMEEVGLSTIASLIKKAKLDVTLSIDGADWSVFAPTDEAFAALGDDLVDCIT